MYRSILASLLVFSLVQGSASWAANKALPQSSTARMVDTPDMTQTDRRAGLPGKGKAYCGPVAASNSLIWLARHGYPNLASHYDGSIKSQASIARALGVKFMATNPEGTNVKRFMTGLYKYVKSKGYSPRYFAFQGWRTHPKAFSTKVAVPRLSFAKRGTIGRSAAWINLGFYKYNRNTNTFKRFGGHWATVIGYGVDENGKRSDETLIVFDPASRNGKMKRANYVHLAPLQSGTMVQKKRKKNAKGFYVVKSGLKLNKKADYGIIDGVVLMVM